MVVIGICYFDEVIWWGDVLLGYLVILGYEGFGIVEKVGLEVINFEVGDYVILLFYVDGICDNCLKGMLIKCWNYVDYNLSGICFDGFDYF